MKKALYILGMFLLVQCGMSIVLVMVTKLLKAHADSGTGELLISIPTLELGTLIITNILIIVFAVQIIGKGWTSPFSWRKPYSRIFAENSEVIAELPDGTAKHPERNTKLPEEIAKFPDETAVFRARRAIILLSLAGMLPLMFAVNALNEWISLPDLMSETFYQMSFSPLALAALAVVGPIAEEFCFRYGVEGALLDDRRRVDGRRTMPRWVAVVVSAAVFGLIHANPAQMVGAFLFGVYFGGLFAFTGSLWPSLLCHVLNNGIAVILMRTVPEDFALTKALDDNALMLMLTLLSLIILGLIIRAMIIVHSRAFIHFSAGKTAEK